MPSWDLPVVQACLQRDPFKPLDSVSDAGMDQEGLWSGGIFDQWIVSYSDIILRPWSGYVLKVPTTPFRDQVVNLQALLMEETDPAFLLLCSIRAL